MITGYAWQKGMLPLSRDAILGAIELNGIAVDWNKQAFEWGRAGSRARAAACPAQPQADVITLVEDEPSHTLQAHFAGELSATTIVPTPTLRKLAWRYRCKN